MLRAMVLFYRRKTNKEEENEGRSRNVMCDKDREGTEQM